ncbi:MAG: response regulator [Woeseiaceae bacterium]|nr:response regulator [Woeseiaceae bacterium]
MATILIIDDLITNRASLADILIEAGHQVVEADDGATGLAAAVANRPDLVITDVLMPGIDGYELVRRLRAEPRTSDIPVVFYTAPYGELEARVAAKAAGIPYVLTKPPLAAEALNIVALALAGNSMEEALEAAELDHEQLRLLGDRRSQSPEDLRTANVRLRALINIGLDFASQRDSDHRLQRLCTAVHDLYCPTYVTLGLLERGEGSVDRVGRVVVSGVEAGPWIAEGNPLAGIFATVVRTHRAARGTSPDGEDAFPGSHPAVKAYLIVPVASLARVYGWICLVGNEGVAFSEEEEQQLMALAGQVGRIYELEHQVSERLQAETALRQSERLNHNLLEHLPHGIIVKDRNSIIRFCNSSYAADLSLTVAEVVGKDASAFQPAELADACSADDQEVMATGVTKHNEERYEVDGKTRWVHTIRVPFRDKQDEITGLLLVFEDITERRLLEQQSQQSQKMAAVGQLAGGIAHDFNNLLTAILGYCELLVTNAEVPEPAREDIAEIHKAGMSAARLTRQLLAFSRKEIIEPTSLDLSSVVADLRPILGRLIREDVKILVGLKPELDPVIADRGQIEQIVINMAINASDAMPMGGTLTIETDNVELDEEYARTHESVTAGPHVALTITDSGCGMTAAVQARIFEPFFTTKPVGQGTGLGLASVHGIAGQVGGSIALDSEIGHGTSFTVYFPRATADTTTAETPVVPVEDLTGTETLLVVEDAAELRSLTSRLLKGMGYTVLVADGAEEALRLIADNPSIDLVLTDVVMPDASGPELIRSAIESRPDLKVVYMSGYTEDTIVQHGVLLPGIAFLPKPFTTEALGRKIRMALDGSVPNALPPAVPWDDEVEPMIAQR